jgi:hypothetical protein
LPYGPKPMSQFDRDQHYAEKGVLAQLRQDKRRENRMSNREGRRTGSFPARPSDVSFLLDGLSSDRMNRDDMRRKGFRNEAARALAKYGAGVAGVTGLSAFQNTPKQITRPQGAFGQPNTIDLNALQRIGLMLGLGPY